MTDDTYSQLRQLAIDLLNKGRADGEVNHEPDTFRKQGFEIQLVHAEEHAKKARVSSYFWSPLDDEDHLAHAFTRILMAALLRSEEE